MWFIYMIFIYQQSDGTNGTRSRELRLRRKKSYITNFFSLKVAFSEGHHTGLIETLNSF